MNYLKLYRGAAALCDTGQPEVTIFFETNQEDPGYNLRELLAKLWSADERDIDVQLICSADYVLKHWCIGEASTGDARLFELGFDADGTVRYAVPERTLFLVTPATLQRLVLAQRSAGELAAAGYRPRHPLARMGDRHLQSLREGAAV